MQLSGKVAVVTGAGGTIGSEMVRQLTEAGAVVIGWDASLGQAAGIVCDVGDQAEVDAAFAATVADFGVPTILINAAGVSGGKAPRARAAIGDEWSSVLSSAQAWEAVFRVNVLGLVNTSRRFAALVSEAGLNGAIVNVTSIAGGPLNDGVLAAYCASKAAANKLTRIAAAEFGCLGIRVNAVAPGTMEARMRFTGTDAPPTPTGQGGGATPFEETLRNTPLEQRAARASDVAAAALGLLALDFVTGEIMLVDGGLMLARSASTSG